MFWQVENLFVHKSVVGSRVAKLAQFAAIGWLPLASVDEFTPRCIGHLPTHVLLSALVFFSNQNNSTRLLPLDGAIELLSSCKGTCQPY